jgi:HK97 family phage portal protein
MFLASAPRADTGDRSVFGNFYFSPVGLKGMAGVRVTPNKAMGLPAVYSCVSVIAKSMALMKFGLFEWTQEDGRRKRIRRTDHWLYRLMARRPNRWQTPFEFRMMLGGHLAMRGNAYCQILDNARGEIVELLPLHPDRMQVELLPNEDYRYIYTDQMGRSIRYSRGSIWHIRWMSDDGIMGLSPLDCAREVIGEGLAMQSYRSRFYANDARPGGWVEFDGNFRTPAAKDAFRESWQKVYGGANRGRVAVLEKGMKYHELKLEDADTKFIKSRGANLADIARIWGVPLHKLGATEGQSKSDIEQLNIEFWTDTMLPWSRLLEDSIEFNLLGEDAGLALDARFDMSELMRGDSVARAQRIRQLILAGVMVRNEGREEEGMDPLPGLEKPLVPLNMSTVDDDGETEPLPNGAGGNASTDDSVAPAPQDGPGARAGRMRVVLQGNANRMARRIAAGNPPAPEVLAEAMALDDNVAAAWLAQVDAGAEEDDIAAELMALAELE